MDEFNQWKAKHKEYFNMPGYRTNELAKYLGVSAKTIQRWLKGQYAPNREQLDKIGKYLEEKKK